MVSYKKVWKHADTLFCVAHPQPKRHPKGPQRAEAKIFANTDACCVPVLNPLEAVGETQSRQRVVPKMSPTSRLSYVVMEIGLFQHPMQLQPGSCISSNFLNSFVGDMHAIVICDIYACVFITQICLKN